MDFDARPGGGTLTARRRDEDGDAENREEPREDESCCGLIWEPRHGASGQRFRAQPLRREIDTPQFMLPPSRNDPITFLRALPNLSCSSK
jgi:hypothetical protein